MTRTNLLAVCRLAAFAMFGCAGGEPDASDEVVELARDIPVPLGGISVLPPQIFTDPTGALTVFIQNCTPLPNDIQEDHPTPDPQHNEVNCRLDPEWVLVGGGASVMGDGEPGALLTASYPDPDLLTWHAKSKDHVASYPHKLASYAIGLKVNGMTAEQLRAHVRIISARSGASQRPSAVAAAEPGTLLIGGGAAAEWSTQGLLLTASHPSADGRSWYAEAKDHKRPEAGVVVSYAIQISESIPGLGALATRVFSQGRLVNTGYAVARVDIEPDAVLTSVGGRSVAAEPGRLLTTVAPTSDVSENRAGAFVAAKDHKVRASGDTVAYAIGLFRR